jgi:ribosomal protein S18 acetylase RimI-like enzyme
MRSRNITLHMYIDKKGHGLLEIFRGIKCREESRIGYLDFNIYKTSLEVSDLTIEDNYQRRGYGTLCIRTMQTLSKDYKVPIQLDSVRDAIKFYRKLGFVHDLAHQGDKTTLIWYPDNRVRCSYTAKIRRSKHNEED